MQPPQSPPGTLSKQAIRKMVGDLVVRRTYLSSENFAVPSEAWRKD